MWRERGVSTALEQRHCCVGGASALRRSDVIVAATLRGRHVTSGWEGRGRGVRVIAAWEGHQGRHCGVRGACKGRHRCVRGASARRRNCVIAAATLHGSLVTAVWEGRGTGVRGVIAAWERSESGVSWDHHHLRLLTIFCHFCVTLTGITSGTVQHATLCVFSHTAKHNLQVAHFLT